MQPKPSNLPKPSVYDFAERVASIVKFEPGSSIEKLVTRLGGRIEYSNPFSDEPDEAIEVREEGDFTILLSTTTSPSRDRFTIAHELGHYFLHYPNFADRHPETTMIATRYVDNNDADQRRAEWEANWFAAAFLMPEEKFKADYESNTEREVAKIFGVSLSAVDVRARSLGLK